MNLQLIVSIIHLFFALSTIVLIFLQVTGENDNKSNLLSSPSSKRGLDQLLFSLTILATIAFLATSLLQTLF